MVKHIEITPELQQAIDAVDAAEEHYLPGGESASVIELPKLALADAFLAALQAQRLAKLPGRARVVPVVVEIEMRPRRRR
jgi:hypothetical protein